MCVVLKYMYMHFSKPNLNISVRVANDVDQTLMLAISVDAMTK